MDEQVVKLLQSIEKLLKGATATSAATPGILGSIKSSFSAKAQQLKQDRDDKTGAKIFRAISADIKDADKAVLALTESMVGLNKEVGKTSSSFGSLQVQMARFGAQLSGGHFTMPVNAPTVPGMKTPSANAGVLSPVEKTMEQLGTPTQRVLGSMLEKFGQTGASLGLFEKAVSASWEALKRLTGDYFQLSRVGMGSVTTLKQLSVDALLAGMSLQEYSALVKENIAFASHAGSMENFAKISSASDDMLASMGIFGAEARDLQVSLANSNVQAGVSGDKLAAAGSAQIQMFDKLRKTTNMTANEFAGLVKSVAESDTAQRELVGLAPAEKQARMAELLSISTTGQRLGLTGKASEELASALIAQRKETVQNRFESAGKIMQLGALVGQGAEGQRAAELTRKGRGKTAAETEELRTLLGGIDKASQGLYEVGTFGMQNVIDQLGPDTGQGLGAAGDIMKASRVVENTAAAGKAFNKDFGQHVDTFGQMVGKGIALYAGYEKSAAPLLAGAVGSALLLAFKGPIFGLFKGLLGMGGSAAGAGAGGAEVAAGGLTMATGIMGLAKMFAKASGYFSAVIEMFTGEISDALNPSGGFFNRIGGMVTAFFTAIPNMIIDIIGFVFSENVSKSLKNGFDQFTSFMMGAIRVFFSDMFGGLSNALDWVGLGNSGLAKKLKAWSGATLDAADENFKAFDTLAADHNKTLTTMAADNQKTAAASTKATEVATTKATAASAKFNNVQFGNTLTAGQDVQDARTILGSPQVQVPMPVTPAAVNTTETAAAPGTAAVAGTSPTDVLTVLNAILQVMNNSLVAEQKQATLTEQLLRSNRTTFNSDESRAYQLLKQT